MTNWLSVILSLILGNIYIGVRARNFIFFLPPTHSDHHMHRQVARKSTGAAAKRHALNDYMPGGYISAPRPMDSIDAKRDSKSFTSCRRSLKLTDVYT